MKDNSLSEFIVSTVTTPDDKDGIPEICVECPTFEKCEGSNIEDCQRSKPSTDKREAVLEVLRDFKRWLLNIHAKDGAPKPCGFEEATWRILSLIEPKVVSERNEIIKAIIELRKELKQKLVEQIVDKPTDHEGHKCLRAKMRTCQDILNLVISQATINKNKGE